MTTAELLPLLEERAQRKAREDFSAFVRYTMPGYTWGWFNEYLCYELYQFYLDYLAGKNPRLMIWAPPRSGSKYSMNPIEQIHALNRVSGTIDLTEHLCRLSDGYFVKNPETIASEMCLLKNTSKVLRKFAMVFDEITGSIENDGIIDAEEAACIDDCWSECKSMVETFVEECKALKYNGDNR